MFVQVGKESQSRLCDDEQPKVVCNANRAGELGTKTQLEEIIRTVDLGK
jgi:hypothetical protein